MYVKHGEYQVAITRRSDGTLNAFMVSVLPTRCSYGTIIIRIFFAFNFVVIELIDGSLAVSFVSALERSSFRRNVSWVGITNEI